MISTLIYNVSFGIFIFHTKWHHPIIARKDWCHIEISQSISNFFPQLNPFVNSFLRYFLRETTYILHQPPRLMRGSSNPSTQFFRSEEHTSELQSRFDIVCRL